MIDHEALPWMPVSPGFELKLLRGGGDDDTRVLLLRLQPDTLVPLHRHAGEVHAFNLSGSRLLIEANEVVGPGGYVYEPPGNVDSWRAVGRVPLVVLVTVRGAMETFGEGGVVVDTSTTGGISTAYRRFRESRP
jgi:quercetin dioxygenase-like cupin family protein